MSDRPLIQLPVLCGPGVSVLGFSVFVNSGLGSFVPGFAVTGISVDSLKMDIID